MSDQSTFGAQGPNAARSEIEQTRARMSETLDEIEEVLLRKKERFRETMDVGARLREKPLVTAGVVLGAGFLIGFLTGGKDKAGEAERTAAQARAALWEERARRLLAIAREQEEDLEEMEGSVLDAAAPASTGSRWKYSPPAAYAFSVDDEDDELDDLEDDDDDLEDDYVEIDIYDDDDDDDEEDDDDDDDFIGGVGTSRLSGLKEGTGRIGGFISNFAQALLEGVRKQM
jgi:hypothetical protein